MPECAPGSFQGKDGQAAVGQLRTAAFCRAAPTNSFASTACESRQGVAPPAACCLLLRPLTAPLLAFLAPGATCTPCEPGKFQVNWAATSCTACDAGLFSASTGANTSSTCRRSRTQHTVSGHQPCSRAHASRSQRAMCIQSRAPPTSLLVVAARTPSRSYTLCDAASGLPTCPISCVDAARPVFKDANSFYQDISGWTCAGGISCHLKAAGVAAWKRCVSNFQNEPQRNHFTADCTAATSHSDRCILDVYRGYQGGRVVCSVGHYFAYPAAGL